MTTTGRRSFLRTRALAAGIALGLSLGAQTAANVARADGDDATSANVLAGTWRVTITTFNCITNVANPPIQSLLTLGADGSLIETTSSPQFAAGQRTIGQGRWERLGPGAYRAVFQAFIVSPLTLPNTVVLQRGAQRVDQGIQIDLPRQLRVRRERPVHGPRGHTRVHGLRTSVHSRPASSARSNASRSAGVE